MDRFQLCRELREAGVPEDSYEIPGCPGRRGGPRPAERWFLEEHDGLWLVGVHERGRREVFERFTDEDRACRWLHGRLTAQGPPPVPATPQETEMLLHDSDGIQRRAREELRRALAEAGHRTGERPPGQARG